MRTIQPSGVRAAAGDLLAGARCAGCGCPGVRLCPTCTEALAPRVRTCWPTPVPPGLRDPPVTPWCAGTYSGVAREVLIAFKEHGRDRLVPVLADALTSALLAGPPTRPRWTLVPMPSRRSSVRARGYDALLLLARVAARQLRRCGRDVLVAPVLKHQRAVADQAGLSAPQRLENLAGAFLVRVPRWPPDREVIVVDDIITTGASAAEATRALRASGAEISRIVVVAATPRASATAGPSVAVELRGGGLPK